MYRIDSFIRLLSRKLLSAKQREVVIYMGKTLVTSDLHIGHPQKFVCEDRGFACIEEHDDALVKKWNSVVEEDDIVYVLGDVMLKHSLNDDNFEYGLNILKSLKGKIIIIRGNHDSEQKVRLYEQCDNVISANQAAMYLKYPEIGGYHFYLSHYPTLVAHEKLKRMKTALINLYGHTHQKEHFYKLNDREHPYMYCVCMDAHDCTPVLMDDIIEEIRKKREEWYSYSEEL